MTKSWRWISSSVFLLVVSSPACAQFWRVDRVDATWGGILDIADAVEAFREARSRLPNSLLEVCAHEDYSEANCPYMSTSSPGGDGWGKRIIYSRDGPEYQLASSGADRAIGTSDDLIFTPRETRRLISQLSGCYRVASPQYPELDGIRFELDSASVSVGAYELNPDRLLGVAGFRRWYPRDGNPIVLRWSRAEDSVVFTLRPSPTGLIGHVGAQGRRVPVSAEQVRCSD